MQHEKNFSRKIIQCGGETIPRSFSKKTKLSISMDQSSVFIVYIHTIKTLFSLYAKSNAIKIAYKLSCRPPNFQAFSKSKKMSGTSLPASYSAWFENLLICLCSYKSNSLKISHS